MSEINFGKTPNGVNVKIAVCFTEGLKFDQLKHRLPVCENDIKESSLYAEETDKVSHLISAALKRKYVGEWTVNDFGKPQGLCCFFNVSHCRGLVVLAISDSEVGIDAENVRPVDNSLVSYVTSESELSFVGTDEDFFRIWTSKESLVKAQGQGLKRDLKSIPAFPFNGETLYQGEIYYRKQIKESNYIITVAQKGKSAFTVSLFYESFL